MRPESAAHLWDASEAAQAVRRFVGSVSHGEFLSDLLRRSAVERQLEILGEALKRLRNDDPVTAARVPDIDKIIGMRNVIAHDYGDVDEELVWAAATFRVPALIEVLDVLLREVKDPGR